MPRTSSSAVVSWRHTCRIQPTGADWQRTTHSQTQLVCNPTAMLNATQALQQWQQLQQQWSSRMPLSRYQKLEAAESAAWLLQRLATQQAQQQLLLEEDVEQLQQQSEVRALYKSCWCKPCARVHLISRDSDHVPTLFIPYGSAC